MKKSKTTSEEWEKNRNEDYLNFYCLILQKQKEIIQNILSIQQNSAYDETKEFIVPNFQEIKDFIRTLILQKQKEAIEMVLPGESQIVKNTDTNMTPNYYLKIGFNSCRSQIIQKAKEKFNIDLN